MKYITALVALFLFASAQAEYGTWEYYSVFPTDDCKGINSQYAASKTDRNGFLSGGYYKSYVGRNVSGVNSPCVNVSRGIYLLSAECDADTCPVAPAHDTAAIEAFAKQKVFEAYGCNLTLPGKCAMTAGLNAEDGGFLMPLYVVEVKVRDWQNCFEHNFTVTLETRSEETWRDSEDFAVNTYVGSATSSHCSGPMPLCGGVGNDN